MDKEQLQKVWQIFMDAVEVLTIKEDYEKLKNRHQELAREKSTLETKISDLEVEVRNLNIYLRNICNTKNKKICPKCEWFGWFEWWCAEMWDWWFDECDLCKWTWIITKDEYYKYMNTKELEKKIN